MFDMFSTREIATGIWLVLFIVILIVHKSTRNSVFTVIKVASSKQLVIPFICILIYAIGLSFLFSLTSIWKWLYIKDISIWVLLVGVPTCFGAVSKKTDNKYFKNMIINNLKFIVLIEFIINSYTFNILVEIFLLPLLAFLYLLDAFAEMNEEYKDIRKFTSYLMAVIGLAIILFALKKAINDYSSFTTVDTLVSFFIPFGFAIFYLPIAYGFAVYAKYQIIFIRMRFKETDDKKIRIQHRWKTIKACTLSYSKLCGFEEKCIKKMYARMSEQEFDEIIRSFKTAVR